MAEPSQSEHREAPPSVDRGGVHRFEQQRRDAALQALQQGRLAEAALDWEVLTVLRPDQDIYSAKLAETRQAIERAVAQRLARASTARLRGDLPAAERGYLEVLGLDPRHAQAAVALRELEVERNRASVVGRFAQPPGLPSRASKGTNMTPMARGGSVVAGSSEPATGQRNLLEHASLLANQGELDAAITLLSDNNGANGSRDQNARKLLARMYVQRADLRAGKDVRAVRADLERALELDPTLQTARAKLQTLKR